LLTDLIQILITIICFVVPWCFPDAKWYIKVIIGLVVLSFSLVALIARKSRSVKGSEAKRKELEDELSEIKEQHTALASLYDSKIAKLQQCQRDMNAFRSALLVSTLNTKEAKLNRLLTVFTELEDRLNNEGDLNG